MTAQCHQGSGVETSSSWTEEAVVKADRGRDRRITASTEVLVRILVGHSRREQNVERRGDQEDRHDQFKQARLHGLDGEGADGGAKESKRRERPGAAPIDETRAAVVAERHASPEYRWQLGRAKREE